MAMDNMAPIGNSQPAGTNRLLQELKRWQPQRRKQLSANRWLTWFLRWTARWRRMVPTWRSPAMALVQPIAFVQRLRERWLMPALQICPRVELAIHPLLRGDRLREMIVKELAVPPFAGPLSKDSLRLSVGELLSRDNRPGEHALSRMKTALTPGDARVAPGNSFVLSETVAPAPLSFVLQRFSGPTALVTTRNHSLAASQRVFALSDHVVRRLRRSEQYVTQPNLIPSRPQPKIVPTETGAPVATEQPGDVFEARSVRSRRQQASPQLRSINVEALTDQVMQRIDRRVVAWRERTGRR